MPFDLNDEQRLKIWESIYNAMYAAEGGTEDALADHSKIVMLDTGVAPKMNIDGLVDTESLVHSTTQVGQLLQQVERAGELMRGSVDSQLPEIENTQTTG